MKNVESQLHKIKDKISLNQSELNTHRKNIESFIDGFNRVPVEKNIKSPYVSHNRHWHLAFAGAFVLFILIGGGTAGAFSIGSLPGDTLYPIKLRIVEPVEELLTFNKTNKVALSIDRVDRRLKEFAQVSLKEDIDPQVMVEAAVLADAQVKEAQAQVNELQASTDVDGALTNAGDLESTLSAHLEILQKIDDSNPTLSDNLTEVIENVTSNLHIAEVVTESVSSTTAATSTPEIEMGVIETKKTDLTEAIVDIQTSVVSNSSIDSIDQVTVQNTIQEINKLIEEGDEKGVDGQNKNALILYSKANQEINKLKILVEADSTTGIDVIDASKEEEK